MSSTDSVFFAIRFFFRVVTRILGLLAFIMNKSGHGKGLAQLPGKVRVTRLLQKHSLTKTKEKKNTKKNKISVFAKPKQGSRIVYIGGYVEV